MTGRGDDILTIKFAGSDGSILWVDTHGGPDGLDDRGWSVVVGADGDPVLAGIIGNADGTADFYTFKLASLDGSLRWERSVPGAVDDVNSRSCWLAACDGGDAVLCGKTWSPATSYDVLIERYCGSDGRTIWSRQYGSSGPISDEPAAMARDAASDLLVAGGCNGDFMVVKFAGEDGRPLWSSSYDGPAHGYDAAECITAGPGDIVGFDTAGGPPLWALNFDSGSNLSEEVRSAAAGPAGDLYAVGYGYGLSTDADILSLRYTLEVPQAVPPAGAHDASGGGPLSVAAWPNPSAGGVRLSLAGPRGERGRVDLMDASGRRVATVWEGLFGPEGTWTWWTGTGGARRAFPPGRYFLALRAAGRSACTAVVRVR
jgi:hypothetical protein